jgi:U2-associated protein SR140
LSLSFILINDFVIQQKTVDDAKLSQYTAGKVRKSRREKEQEAAEEKKREEEESAAKAYAEFLDAFESEDVGKKKTGSNFVKASTESKTAYMSTVKPISEGLMRPSRAFNVVS